MYGGYSKNEIENIIVLALFFIGVCIDSYINR